MADYSLLVNVEAIDKASATFSKIQGNVNKFKSDLEGAGTVGTNSMEQLGTSMQNLGGRMSSTGKLMTATVTAPIVGLGTAAVKTTADFDSAMSQVSAVSGATGKDLQDLRDKAREMGAKTKFSASEAAEGMNYMAMAGWKTSDMLSGIEGIMNLAAASGENLGTTSDIVTDALTAFGLSAKDSGHFADILAAASSNANTNVSMMGETFKYAAPVAGALGFSAEDTAEAIGLMANSGIKASQAGTSLRSIMTNLAGEVKFSGAAFGEMEVATTNADGSMRSLNDILADCRVAFSQMSESEKAANAEALVGKNAMSGFLALMNAAPSDIEKLNGAITNCDGSAEKMADTMNDNLNGQMTILKSQLQELAISFGEALVPTVREAVSVLQKIVDGFNKLSPTTKETIARVLAITAAVGPVLLIGGKLISGIGTLITLGAKVGGVIGSIGGAAGAAAAPTAAAGSAMGALSANALGFVALGAGILLAAGGLALIAHAAVEVGQAGLPAAAAMAAMVGTIALLAVGAAALAPALTAGAVGLVAFGAAVALVGVGALAAAAGLSMLAPHLPTIAASGTGAAVAITALAGALTLFAGGATVAGAGAVVLGAGLVTASAGMVAAAASAAVLAGGVTVLSGGIVILSGSLTLCAGAVTLLGAGLQTCAAPIVTIGNNATTAAVGITAMTAAMTALLVPVGATAGLVMAADAAFLVFDAEMVVSAVAIAAVDVALVGMLATMSGIADAASSAASSMKTIQSSVDVVKTGVNGLGDAIGNTVGKIVNTFTSQTPNMQSAANNFGLAMTNGVKTGMQPLPTNVKTTLTQIQTNVQQSNSQISMIVQTSMTKNVTNVTQGGSRIRQAWTQTMTQLNSDTRSRMTQVESTIQASLNKIQSMFRNTRLEFSQHVSVPHFSMSGSFNAQTGSVPSVHVSWYKKAYDQAMMFNAPTVMGATGMGFGDGVGSEVVVGDDHLVELMRDALKDSNNGTIVIPVYVGNDIVDELVIDANNRNNYRSGGR